MTLAIVACSRSRTATATQAFTFEQQAGGQPGKCEQKEYQSNQVNFHGPLFAKYTNTDSRGLYSDAFLKISQPL